MAKIRITDTRASQALLEEEAERAFWKSFRAKYQPPFLLLVLFFVGLLVTAWIVYKPSLSAMLLGILGIYLFSRILYNAIFGGHIRSRDVWIIILLSFVIFVDIVGAGLSHLHEIESRWALLAKPTRFRAALVRFLDATKEPLPHYHKRIVLSSATLQGLQDGARQLQSVWIAETPCRQSDLDEVLAKRMDIRRNLDRAMEQLIREPSISAMVAEDATHPVLPHYQALVKEWAQATHDLPALQHRYEEAKAAYYAEIGKFPYNLFYSRDSNRFYLSGINAQSPI